MMYAVLMAQDDGGTVFSTWTSPGSSALQVVIVVGIILLVAGLFFAWAAFWRKPRRRKHSYHAPPEAALPARHDSNSGMFHRKHRRHRRHHRDRPLNPTLSQVGGLPPKRDGNPPAT